MAVAESFNSYHNLGNGDLPNTPNDVQNAWDELAALARDGAESGPVDMTFASAVETDDVNRYDIAEMGQTVDYSHELVEDVNEELRRVAPEGYDVSVDLDLQPNTDAIELAEDEPDRVGAEEAESPDVRETMVKSLRERLKSRPSFVKQVGRAVQGMIERVRSRLGRTEVEDDSAVQSAEQEMPAGDEVQEQEANQPVEYGVSEQDMEEQFRKGEGATQEKRRQNIRRLEGIKAELERRIWQSRDNLMQERLAQMLDQVEAKILATRAIIVMVERQEQMRFRPRTEMESHGQFALEYLQANGIFEGPYDEEGLKDLRDLREKLELKVVKAAVDQDEMAGNEYVTQLEYIRPAIRELERAIHHPDEWKKIKFIQTDQKAG